MPRRTHADIASEWAAVGDAVARNLPPVLERRLIAAVKKLHRAPPVVAAELVTALAELVAGRPRPPLTAADEFALLELQARRARHRAALRRRGKGRSS